MGEITPDRVGRLAVEGKEVHWEYHGQGDREPVCLLNGLAMHTRAWYPFLQRLQPDYDVVLYDYPGQGQSSLEDRPSTMPELAGYLDLVAAEAGFERVHVMGISYGGFVAADFARLYPHRVHTLTLSGILLTREKLFDMYQDISLAFYEGGPALFPLYTRYMYEKIFGESFVQRAWGQLEEMRTRFHDRYIDSIHALVQLTLAQNHFFVRIDQDGGGYDGIEAPTLILAGLQDRTIPPWVQRKIAGIIPGSRYVELEDAGHVVYLEQAERFFEALRRFMKAGDPHVDLGL